MFRRIRLAAGLALALAGPALAGDPQKFGDEAKATAFCKAGNVVWFNPDSEIYPAGQPVLRQNESRRLYLPSVCREGRIQTAVERDAYWQGQRP